MINGIFRDGSIKSKLPPVRARQSFCYLFAGHNSRIDDAIHRLKLREEGVLPTIITHSVIAATSGLGFSSGKESLKFWILSIACSSLPDADVIGYRYLYIPTYEFFGHRGFFHSPFFAALLGIFIVCIFYRKEGFFSNNFLEFSFSQCVNASTLSNFKLLKPKSIMLFRASLIIPNP